MLLSFRRLSQEDSSIAAGIPHSQTLRSGVSLPGPVERHWLPFLSAAIKPSLLLPSLARCGHCNAESRLGWASFRLQVSPSALHPALWRRERAHWKGQPSTHHLCEFFLRGPKPQSEFLAPLKRHRERKNLVHRDIPGVQITWSGLCWQHHYSKVTGPGSQSCQPLEGSPPSPSLTPPVPLSMVCLVAAPTAVQTQHNPCPKELTSKLISLGPIHSISHQALSFPRLGGVASVFTHIISPPLSSSRCSSAAPMKPPLFHRQT